MAVMESKISKGWCGLDGSHVPIKEIQGDVEIRKEVQLIRQYDGDTGQESWLAMPLIGDVQGLMEFGEN